MPNARLALVIALLAPGVAMAKTYAASNVTHDQAAGGEHWRFDTDNGPVHAFTPPDYDATTAGIVVYVHGHYATADTAWSDHQLADQFAASRVDALFIVCEAAQGNQDDPKWASLGDLIRTTIRATGLARPTGALVAMGHSGAFTTLALWLDYTPLDDLILLDALYGREDDFRAWLETGRGHRSNRMVLVSEDTRRKTEAFVGRFSDAVTVDAIPDSYDELDQSAREARVLHLRSQYKHMDIVTEGKTIPLVLRRTRLSSLD